MKKNLLILLTLFITVIGYSQTFTDNFITYNITSTTMNTVEVTGYNSAGGTAVIIPETVMNSNITYSVTSIGDFAFVNKLLTSLSIGNNIVNIGMLAFNNNLLSTLTIPDSVTTLGNQAFSFNQLTSVISEATTPPTIITGGNNDTFGDRSSINLTIPNGTENAYIAAQWINFASVILNISDFELISDIKVITTADAIKVISPDSVRLENYTIYSITGAKVTTGTESEISTSFLANGIYVLKLNFDKGTVTKKVVVN